MDARTDRRGFSIDEDLAGGEDDQALWHRSIGFEAQTRLPQLDGVLGGVIELAVDVDGAIGIEAESDEIDLELVDIYPVRRRVVQVSIAGNFPVHRNDG